MERTTNYSVLMEQNLEKENFIQTKRGWTPKLIVIKLNMIKRDQQQNVHITNDCLWILHVIDLTSFPCIYEIKIFPRHPNSTKVLMIFIEKRGNDKSCHLKLKNVESEFWKPIYLQIRIENIAYGFATKNHLQIQILERRTKKSKNKEEKKPESIRIKQLGERKAGIHAQTEKRRNWGHKHKPTNRISKSNPNFLLKKHQTRTATHS